jgi:hypothetical protein
VLATFVLYERSLPSTSFPLVQLSLFATPSFRVGVIISAAFLAGIPSFFFVFILTLQAGLGYSALHAGMTTLPWTAGVAYASTMSTRLAPRLGKWTIVLGASLLVAGALAVFLTLQIDGVDVTSLDLIPAFLVSGLGLDTVLAPLLTVILAGVPPRDAGSASGVLTTFQQLGGALGVALIGVAFFTRLGGVAPAAVSGASPGLRADLVAARLPTLVVGSTVATFRRCFQEQASSSDPTRSVPDYASATRASSPVGIALVGAGRSAIAHDFVDSVEPVIFFQVGFWTLTGVLALFLPRVHVNPHTVGEDLA